MAGIASTPELLAAAAVGAAASAALEPAFEVPRQDAWSNNRNRIHDAQLAARLVAQGGIALSDGRQEAHREGFSDDKFDQLVYLAQTVPGVSEALRLWRLGLLGDGLFRHVLVKAGLDQRYADPILNSKLAEVVGLGDIGYGVVRGILPAPAWVPVAPPAHGDKVPRFPQVDIDPLELAHKLGFDEDMLKLIVGRSGLSMAPGLAAQAEFRGIIGPNDFLLAIAEGDLRTEWADALHEVSRAIPTVHDAVQLRLRGWTDDAGMYEQAHRHGMRDADTDRLLKISGRPLSFHQVFIGLRRGGVYDGPTDGIDPAFLKSLQESDIRPEWYNLAWAQRHTFPTAFVLRSLTENGDLTGDEAHQILLDEGWRPDLAQKVSARWAGGSGSSADTHVAKAQTQLWTTTHRSYIAEEITDAAATTALEAAGVAAASVPAVLQLWQAERALIRKQLSPTQIAKAYNEQVVNPATGQPWTKADALAELLQRGYDQNDAQTLLEL